MVRFEMAQLGSISRPASITLGLVMFLVPLSGCIEDDDDGFSEPTPGDDDDDDTGAQTPGETPTATPGETPSSPTFQLTLLHHGDAGSQLIDAGDGLADFGGIARFGARVDELRQAAVVEAEGTLTYGALLLSTGDTFRAGLEFSASLENGPPFYDSRGMSLIGYDAVCLGNHDFDFGPEVLADFIGGVTTGTPFLSVNLDFRGEPALQALATSGRLRKSVVLTVSDQPVGVIGAITSSLPSISSPRDVEVDRDVVDLIQAEVDALRTAGVNKIILLSHLRDLDADLDLIPELRGIDVMIAGGGTALLADEDDELLVPDGDEDPVPYGPYPILARDADNREVAVVTTEGGYRYVGRLIIRFDDEGRTVEIDDESGPVRVAAETEEEGIEPDEEIEEQVVNPVIDYLEELDRDVVAVSEVDLDAERGGLSTRETNAGDLVADAHLYEARELASDYHAPEPDIALIHAAGIGSDAVLEAGDITALDTFDLLPAGNFLTIVEDVTPEALKEILENAVSRVELADSRFAQVAGFRFTWDAQGAPRVADDDGDVTQAGSRVLEVILDDGTTIVENGELVNGAPDLHVATLNVLANGGAQYPFDEDADFTTLGVTSQQALVDYLQSLAGTEVSETDYPDGGDGRITRID